MVTSTAAYIGTRTVLHVIDEGARHVDALAHAVVHAARGVGGAGGATHDGDDDHDNTHDTHDTNNGDNNTNDHAADHAHNNNDASTRDGHNGVGDGQREGGHGVDHDASSHKGVTAQRPIKVSCDCGCVLCVHVYIHDGRCPRAL